MDYGRILAIIIGGAFLVWYFWNSWKKASNYSEAEAEKGRMWQEIFPKFKEDSRFKELKKHIDSKYKTIDDNF